MASTNATTIDHTLPLSSSAAMSATLWVCAFAVLTFAGANIVIPTFPIPMTLQTPFVLLAGALLGRRLGAFSQLAYLGAGAIGLPVFAFGGGLLYFATGSGGYLLAFPLAAFVTGLIVHHRATAHLALMPRVALGMTVGLACIFTVGTLWLAEVQGLGYATALSDGFAKLQIWDGVKLTGTVLVATLALRNARAT